VNEHGGTEHDGAGRRIAAVAALADSGRRAIYRLVSASPVPVGRDEVAASAGLSRSTAAFHLDRLAEEGLVEVEYRRRSNRMGPGSGRPAKLYSRARTELTVTLPERHYELAADLLARAIEESTGAGVDIRTAVRSASQEAGRSLGSGASSLIEALEHNGFEPIQDADDVVLGNCPFHRLAQQHTSLVCDLNRSLVDGIRAGAEDTSCAVLADPGAGRCCVRITRDRPFAEDHLDASGTTNRSPTVGEDDDPHHAPHAGSR
jgi:predicted ArsR family transcriptional regulator